MLTLGQKENCSRFWEMLEIKERRRKKICALKNNFDWDERKDKLLFNIINPISLLNWKKEKAKEICRHKNKDIVPKEENYYFLKFYRYWKVQYISTKILCLFTLCKRVRERERVCVCVCISLFDRLQCDQLLFSQKETDSHLTFNFSR